MRVLLNAWLVSCLTWQVGGNRHRPYMHMYLFCVCRPRTADGMYCCAPPPPPACCLQCACGGVLRVIKTKPENKEKYHLENDFFIGCSRYKPSAADSCTIKYLPSDLAKAVSVAPKDWCR